MFLETVSINFLFVYKRRWEVHMEATQFTPTPSPSNQPLYAVQYITARHNIISVIVNAVALWA